jgi:glutamyl/glutaminyl-tRNA synthetase
VLLRLEDLDPERCQPAFAQALITDLAWFGLTFDVIEWQSAHHARHAEALDRLAACGLLYPSAVSRREFEAHGKRTPDGGWAYDNRDRGTPLPGGDWRSCHLPLRVQLPDMVYNPIDDSGFNLQQIPTLAFGDPIVRRRDGAIAYHLAAVVDDAAVGVTHVVRGRDIASSTATQVALQQILGLPTPRYYHHLLLLERREQKLAKLHGAVGVPVLRHYYSAQELCGWLAYAVGLLPQIRSCAPIDLLPDFAWSRVRNEDVLVNWTGTKLEIGHD